MIRTARGHAPILTDADLDAMAEVTPDDVAEALEFWEQNAPEDSKGLLDAEPDEEDRQ